MKILDTYFGKALVLEGNGRVDCRGTMLQCFSDREAKDLGLDFSVRDLRMYAMPKTGTFFGIHYYEKDPVNRILTVVQGRGMDYLIDLRPGSPTYLQYVQYELSAENKKVVYIPYGIGHAFISLEENTIQAYATDTHGNMGITKQLHYSEPKIGLSLPCPITAISDYDEKAPLLDP